MNILELAIDADYRENIALLERATLHYTMHKVKYNQSKAAKIMGISRGTLRYKLKQYFNNDYFRDSE